MKITKTQLIACLDSKSGEFCFDKFIKLLNETELATVIKTEKQRIADKKQELFDFMQALRKDELALNADNLMLCYDEDNELDVGQLMELIGIDGCEKAIEAQAKETKATCDMFSSIQQYTQKTE